MSPLVFGGGNTVGIETRKELCWPSVLVAYVTDTAAAVAKVAPKRCDVKHSRSSAFSAIDLSRGGCHSACHETEGHLQDYLEKGARRIVILGRPRDQPSRHPRSPRSLSGIVAFCRHLSTLGNDGASRWWWRDSSVSVLDSGSVTCWPSRRATVCLGEKEESLRLGTSGV